jgi:hypothetical protein
MCKLWRSFYSWTLIFFADFSIQVCRRLEVQPSECTVTLFLCPVFCQKFVHRRSSNFLFEPCYNAFFFYSFLRVLSLYATDTGWYVPYPLEWIWVKHTYVTKSLVISDFLFFFGITDTTSQVTSSSLLNLANGFCMKEVTSRYDKNTLSQLCSYCSFI